MDKNFVDEVEQIKQVQKCPKCGELSLQFIDNMLRCTKCSFEAKIGGL